MWGTLDDRKDVVVFDRFIPTHVGNSFHALENFPLLTVHPHACGELFSDHLNRNMALGSSPRMWGTLFLQVFPVVEKRFIPTHVGELLSFLISFSLIAGSSPRMCGTRMVGGDQRCFDRFIPTHVGNSISLPWTVS